MNRYAASPPCVSPTYVARRHSVRGTLVALACDANGRATGELIYGARYMGQFRVHYYERNTEPTLKSIVVQAVDQQHARGEGARVLGKNHGVSQSYLSRYLIVEANPITGSLYPRAPSANPCWLLGA